VTGMSIITMRLKRLLGQYLFPQAGVMKSAPWIAVFPAMGQAPQKLTLPHFFPHWR